MTVKTTKEMYYEGIGRRKKSIARVRIFPKGKKEFIINGRERDHYFATKTLRTISKEPYLKFSSEAPESISVVVRGGGVKAQAEAIRLGLSRALVKYDQNLRISLKTAGFLTSDARRVERKKFGLKKARRAPQWSKR